MRKVLGIVALGLLATPAADAWFVPLPSARNSGCFSFPTWTARDSARQWHGMAVSADGTEMMAPVYAGNLYISTNSGATWTAKTAAGTSRNFNSVAGSRNFDTLVAMDNGGASKIAVSTDGGTTWTFKDSARAWYRIAMSQDGNIMYAILTTTTTSKIYKSTDMGSTWATLPNSASTTWNVVKTSANGQIVLAGTTVAGSSVYISTDGGASWATKAISGPSGAAAMTPDGQIMVVGQWGGKIAISTNGGSTFTSTTSPVAQWNDLAMSSDGSRILAAPQNTFLQTSADGGATWTSNSTNSQWITAGMSADGSVVASAILGGQIYTSSCKAINR